MRILKAHFLFLILISQLSFGQLNRDSILTTVGYTTTIESEYLNQTKTLLVSLPIKFDEDKEYPLIVLTDFMAFKPLASITEIMAYNQTIPWSIVVCAITTNVQEEYSPVIDNNPGKVNGGKTLLFYENELLPFLLSKYKISKKILWGKGFSGTFSTFVMLSEPDLFDAYISDTPNLELIDDVLKGATVFAKENAMSMSYYLTGSVTDKKDDAAFVLQQKMRSNQLNNLDWNYVENNDSIFISRIITNYTHALDFFFNKTSD